MTTTVEAPPPRTVPLPPAEPQDRWSLVWGRKPVIAGVALAAGVLVLGLSALMPSTYRSSATVAVQSSYSSRGGALDAVTASNDLAAQLAPVASSAPVVDAAARALRLDAEALTGRIGASAFPDQNVITISVESGTASGAEAAAAAVAAALVTQVDEQAAASLAAYDAQVTGGLAPLTASIRDAVAEVRAATTAAGGARDARTQALALGRLEAARSLLADLRVQQQSHLATAALNRPAVADARVLTESGAAEKVTPRPFLYAAAAAAVAAVLAIEFLVADSRRRRPAAGPRARTP